MENICLFFQDSQGSIPVMTYVPFLSFKKFQSVKESLTASGVNTRRYRIKLFNSVISIFV